MCNAVHTEKRLSLGQTLLNLLSVCASASDMGFTPSPAKKRKVKPETVPPVLHSGSVLAVSRGTTVA